MKLIEIARSAVIFTVRHFSFLNINIISGLLFLFIFFIQILPVRGAEFPEPYDMDGQVNFLEKFLEQFSDSISLQTVDGFESENQYYVRNPSTDLEDVRYVFKVPDRKARNAFEKEKEIIQKYDGKQIDFEKSLFIHTSFNISGQNFQLLSKQPVELKGQLFRASLWIHSNNTYNTLSLLFKNADGRNVEVNLGRMNWKGWRRIDVKLPPSLYRRGKNFQTRYRHSFTGFALRSPTGRDPENPSIMIDNLLVLSDIREVSYPGSEILDNWK